jgi:hypothetical protein
VTMLRFSGGEVVRVNLSFEDVRELLRDALASNGILEFEDSDGTAIIVNPLQVQIVQDADAADAQAARADGVTAAA